MLGGCSLSLSGREPRRNRVVLVSPEGSGMGCNVSPLGSQRPRFLEARDARGHLALPKAHGGRCLCPAGWDPGSCL